MLKKIAIVSFIILFTFFIPGVKFLNFNLKIDVLMIISLSLFLLLEIKKLYFLNKSVFIASFFYFLFIFSGVISGVINNTFDIYSMRGFLYPLIKSFIVINFIFICLFRYGGGGVYEINRGLLWCFFLDSLFKLFELVFPEVKMSWLNVISIDDEWKNTLGLRNLGIKGISIYDYAVAASLAVIIDFLYDRRNFFNKFIYPIVLVSAMTSGRTAIFVFLIFILFNLDRVFVRKMYAAFIGVIVLVVMFQIFGMPSIINPEMQWVFEPIVNILEGRFETESTNDLLENHLFLPENLFGYGIWAQFGDIVSGEIRGTDSGFILLIIFSGWLGVSFFVISQCFLLILCYSSMDGKYFYRIYLPLLMSIFFIMIKGPIIYSEYVSFILFMLLSSHYGVKINEKKNYIFNCDIQNRTE